MFRRLLRRENQQSFFFPIPFLPFYPECIRISIVVIQGMKVKHNHSYGITFIGCTTKCTNRHTIKFLKHEAIYLKSVKIDRDSWSTLCSVRNDTLEVLCILCTLFISDWLVTVFFVLFRLPKNKKAHKLFSVFMRLVTIRIFMRIKGFYL